MAKHRVDTSQHYWSAAKGVAVAEYHKHLDECSHCNANPFNLCAKGNRLLNQAAQAALVGRIPK